MLEGILAMFSLVKDVAQLEANSHSLSSGPGVRLGKSVALVKIIITTARTHAVYLNTPMAREMLISDEALETTARSIWKTPIGSFHEPYLSSAQPMMPRVVPVRL